MKIVVATIGSRGDVQPYLNLCQGLQEAGHDVTLATNPTLLSLAAAHGVKCRPVGSPVDMGAEGARLMAASFNNMWLGLIRVMQLGARLVEEAYPDVIKLCRGADLIITSDTGSGIAEAESLGMPWISVTLQPGRLPVNTPPTSAVGRVFARFFNYLMTAPTNASRKRLGAPPVKDISSMMSNRMILLPVSRLIAPPDPRWPGHVCQTNYWYARSQPGWIPPQDLVDFLKAGEKPIAVSLGVMSTSGKQARQGAQIVLDAVRQAGVRAVIQGWDGILEEIGIPETVYHAGSMPHNWLFDQVSSVVHHGGFGTTAAVLRSGVPGIIIPHIIDQFYWGQQVFQMGVGPKYISRGKLKAEGLSLAIRKALEDAAMRAKASEIGLGIRSAPDGVIEAVEVIGRLR